MADICISSLTTRARTSESELADSSLVGLVLHGKDMPALACVACWLAN